MSSYPYYQSYEPIDNEDYNKTLGLQNPPAKMKIPIILVYGSICITLMGIGVFISASLNAKEAFGNPMAYYFPGSIKATPTTTTSTTDTKKSDTRLNFTLKRKNYNPVPYFENEYKSSSFLNYKILENYDAIIEPNQAMELYFYDESLQQYNYEFFVCPAGLESCDAGYSRFDAESGLHSSKLIQYSCSPYDTFLQLQ
jgi:hypothetical protein